MKMLEECEDRLAHVNARLDFLEKRAKRCAATRAEIENRLREIIAAVEKMDRTSGDKIKLLVGEIRAAPYQQFGSNLVLLRAASSCGWRPYSRPGCGASWQASATARCTNSSSASPCSLTCSSRPPGRSTAWRQ